MTAVVLPFPRREPGLNRQEWETTSRSIVYLYACPTCRPHQSRRSRVRPVR